MADQTIHQLVELTTPVAADELPIFSLSSSDTKRITVKNLIQTGAGLVDDASIPVAKVNLSGISGTNLTNGTVTAAKLDTSTIPATGGVTVSSSNLQLVAPTSPIVRNASTGSLEHATSGATAGTYTKVTVDTRGHVTVGATLAGADVPVATSSVVGGVSIPAAGGFTLTGGGALSHSNAVAGGASTRSGITYDLQGHIVSTAALVAADLPVATTAVKGAVIAGTGLAVDGNGILSTSVATTSVLGGIKIGDEFGLNGSNQLLLAVQANVAGGTAYPKVTVNSKGVVTAGAALTATDIPVLDASKITTGSVDIARIAANTITGAKVANYAVTKIGDTQPTADHIGQFFFNPLTRDLFLWDGNVFQPIGISVGEIVFAGTFDASTGSGTGLVASVTAEGTAVGLTVGQPLPAAATGNSRYYLVVSEAGTITSGNAPQVALTPPDIVLSNGTSWTEIDVSQTITAQVASNVSFTPAGSISSANVQLAIQELDTEKLPIAGGTVTGNLEIGTTGSLSFEGSTANAFETTVAVVDPTADRTITLPNISGTVITTGDTGTVTSTMLLDGTILNADINASAAIEGSKIVAATTSVVGAVQLSDSTSTTSSVLAATPTAVKASFDLATAALPKAGGTLTGDITLNAQSDVRFADADSSNYVALQAPATVTSNVTFTLPSADGTNGQVLGTNGSGVLSFSTPSGGTILYNRRPALHRGPLFTKTAATTISVTAGAVLNGQYYASATAVTMGTHTNNTDMAIWQHPTTGALVSDASYTAAPAGATGGSIVGGYHYIPSGRPTAFNSGSPTSTAEILEFSIWDLTWRPVCPDPRGMTCVDGRFWCDLYFCGSTSYATTTFSAVPSSKIGLTIADNGNPALIPSFYGGNGSTAYSLLSGVNPESWYNFAEVAHSFGKRFMWSWEFQAAAFGAPEAGSRGSDPGTVIWERQSKWGLAQATGTMNTFAAEHTSLADSPSNTNTGGRGTVFGTQRVLNVGGYWTVGSISGSRQFEWRAQPQGDGVTPQAARFAAEHVISG